jgi:hypothetical protein
MAAKMIEGEQLAAEPSPTFSADEEGRVEGTEH